MARTSRMKIDEVLQKSEIFQLFQLFAFDRVLSPTQAMLQSWSEKSALANAKEVRTVAHRWAP